ncbi:hypothetical protein HerbRD11066_23210 [Herbidospora sp. RD11066]
MATLLAVVVSAPVEAVAGSGAPDPVKAVQKQLRHGHGVRLSELSVGIFGADHSPLDRMHAQVQLSPRGPVAYDASWYSMPRPGADPREVDERAAFAGMDWDDVTYVGGVRYLHYEAGVLPGAKSWVREAPSRTWAQDFTDQPVDLFDAKMLRGLLRGVTGKAVPGGYVYRGAATLEQVGYSSRFRPKDKIDWWLWTDAQGLPTRLRTRDVSGSGYERLGAIFDTRYRDWGFPLVVTAPAADQVIDEDDVR